MAANHAAAFYGVTEENVAPPTDACLLPRALPLTVVLGKGKPNGMHGAIAPTAAAATDDAAFEEMLLSILPQQQQQEPTTAQRLRSQSGGINNDKTTSARKTDDGVPKGLSARPMEQSEAVVSSSLAPEATLVSGGAGKGVEAVLQVPQEEEATADAHSLMHFLTMPDDPATPTSATHAATTMHNKPVYLIPHPAARPESTERAPSAAAPPRVMYVLVPHPPPIAATPDQQYANSPPPHPNTAGVHVPQDGGTAAFHALPVLQDPDQQQHLFALGAYPLAVSHATMPAPALAWQQQQQQQPMRLTRCPPCRRRKVGGCGGRQATAQCYRRTGQWQPRDVALATPGRKVMRNNRVREQDSAMSPSHRDDVSSEHVNSPVEMAAKEGHRASERDKQRGAKRARSGDGNEQQEEQPLLARAATASPSVGAFDVRGEILLPRTEGAALGNVLTAVQPNDDSAADMGLLVRSASAPTRGGLWSTRAGGCR